MRYYTRNACNSCQNTYYVGIDVIIIIVIAILMFELFVLGAR